MAGLHMVKSINLSLSTCQSFWDSSFIDARTIDFNSGGMLAGAFDSGEDCGTLQGGPDGAMRGCPAGCDFVLDK